MPYENLIVETSDTFVGEITLNRPDQMNTFTTLHMKGQACSCEWLQSVS